MDFQPVDRLPIYYFGAWKETFQRWAGEGIPDREDIPGTTGMDPDWETGLWDAHGLVRIQPIADQRSRVVVEDDCVRVVRTAIGALVKESKQGSSIPQHVEEALLPTRRSWKRFQRFIDPADPRRYVPGWEMAVERLNARHHLATFLAGSLFGWPRDWMGVENISYLSYDDPILYEAIIDHLATFFMELYRPILRLAQFDFAYFFEDCCFNTGPMFSPDTYRRFYHKYYRRMIEFYRGMGIRYIMMDSDGNVETLVPLWLDSGFDIVFPVEVGTWKASPIELRKRFGRNLRMFGGVDKHVIPRGKAAIRAHLEPLRPVVEEGGYIPIPDHRIPPDCSLNDMRAYVRVFNEVFNERDSCGENL
jgi:hypothetical protein